MVNNLQAFVPTLVTGYPGPAGLRIQVGPPGTNLAGTISINNVLYLIPTQYVNVQQMATTYVYVELTGATIQTNNSGFTGSVWPIAIVSANMVEITNLQDVRPDLITIGTGGGGGGSSVDNVLAIAAPQTLPLALGDNLLAQVVAAANPVTLPSPVGLTGQVIKVIKTDTGASVTIHGGIEGDYFLSAQYQYVQFESNNVAWLIVGNN